MYNIFLILNFALQISCLEGDMMDKHRETDKTHVLSVSRRRQNRTREARAVGKPRKRRYPKRGTVHLICF